MNKISSNWNSASDIEKCAEITKDSDFKGFQEESLDASNCIQLTRPEQCQDSLYLTIKVEDLQVISRIVLVGQSKRVEIFAGSWTDPGPYLKTICGTLSEDSDDDFKVFLFNDLIQDPKHSQITLKLTGIQDSCWLLNMIIVTSQSSFNPDRFDLSNLSPDLLLSDKAKDFKKLFETFQKTKPPSLIPTQADPEILKSMMSMRSQIPEHKNSKGCDECLAKLDSLEKKILDRLDQQDAKLNHILDILQSSK